MTTSAPPIPRVELAFGPTPLLHLERLSRELGVELWIKRDDLTGLLESGNEIRKLEFLVGEALAQNADTLVTCGRLQSDGCRAVAAVAARLGLKAVLAVKGARPEEDDGNYLLDRLLGADVHCFSDDEWTRIDERLQDLAVGVRRRGGVPYLIPESGASVAGALGYFVCGQELTAQIHHGAPAFDSVVITAFSGASQAGLLMARQLAGLASDVVGIPIARSASEVRAAVVGLLEAARRRYGLGLRVPDDVRLLDGYQAGGDGGVSPEVLRTVVMVARQEGVVLDPQSTGTAFAGLVDTLRRDPHALGRRVCFVHTGGIFSLFPFRRALRRLMDDDALVES
jgi:D-cysteine desulfhydrase